MRTAFSSTTSTYDSPAKINLCLRIVGRRADGYHLLDSIFATIDLVDRIRISVRDVGPSGATHVDVHCAYPGVPNDVTNLAARAALTLLDECGLRAYVAIAIEKRVPPGAGLGGGSSNAATVLRGLNAMLRLDVPEGRLHQLALGLGADVPFFLTGGCARVRGIGESIQPIYGWPGLPVIVALPPLAVSTAWAFRAYSATFARDPDEPVQMAAGVAPSPTLMVNDLETAVLPAHPKIAQVKQALVDAGASASVMSGSGAAVVALVPPSTSPEVVATAFHSRHPDVRVHCTRILPAATYAVS